MANLIVTVFAIILVGLLSLVVAYYGGEAILAGGARAQAATIVDDGAQIATAWTMRATNAENDYDGAVNVAGSGPTLGRPFKYDAPGALAPGYLQDLPKPPPAAAAEDFAAANLTDSAVPTAFDGVVLRLRDDAATICSEIAAQAAPAGQPKPALGANDNRPTPGRRYDCIFADANSNNQLDPGESPIRFVYQVR